MTRPRTAITCVLSRTARIAGKAKICLIAINADKGKTIIIAKRARLSDRDGPVFANSKDSTSLPVRKAG